MRTIICARWTYRRDKSLTGRINWSCSSKYRLVLIYRLALISIDRLAIDLSRNGCNRRTLDMEARRNGIWREVDIGVNGFEGKKKKKKKAQYTYMLCVKYVCGKISRSATRHVQDREIEQTFLLHIFFILQSWI